MVTYDTVEMVEEKTNFIRDRNLGGGMWFEASGDKGGQAANKADGSLIGTYVEGITANGQNMERALNVLRYPESKYDNLRAGFPGQ